MLTDIVAQLFCGMMAGMNISSITVYGIRNCDSVRQARQWLSDQGLAYRFHDFKAQGVPPERLDHWLASAGWESVLNRKGTTWRKLDDATRSAATDSAGARAVMLAHPSVIKRPVVEWPGDGPAQVSVGFKPEDWLARLAAAR